MFHNQILFIAHLYSSVQVCDAIGAWCFDTAYATIRY